MNNTTKLGFLLPCIFVISGISALQKNSTDGVSLYRVSEHEPVVKAIALQNFNRLTEVSKDPEEAYRIGIKPILEHAPTHAKVYLLNEKPVGFITYTIAVPWYRKNIFPHMGPNAVIHHLAVDGHHKKLGCGSALLKDAIEDCKKKSVNKISLTVTDWVSLSDYYNRFGFSLESRNAKGSLTGTLALRLKHPLLSLLKFKLK